MMFFNVSEGGGNLSQGDESGDPQAEDTSERICSALVLYMRLLDEIFE